MTTLLRSRSKAFTSNIRIDYGILAELGLILAWAVIVTLPYLKWDPALVPAGREYLHHISSHHVWTRFQECGLCALWNASVRGGYPAFADVQSSTLHPYVAITTLLFGVLNGAKVMLFLAFATAGLAQWWLGKTIGLGSLPRTWTALMAVAGGHLAGRMEGGVPGLVLALASCALALAAVVAFARFGSWRHAVALGVSLALTLLAGQGYIQIGFLLLLPLAAILVLRPPVPRPILYRRLLAAAGLALLLAAPFLLPAFHFLPEMVKGFDPDFGSTQRLKFAILNLLIDDGGFYHMELLRKLPYPSLYVNYIGWIPFLLAVWGIDSTRVSGSARTGLFLAATALGALWLAAGTPLLLAAKAMPVPAVKTFIYGIRYTPLFVSLAVPPVLALAGIGLARLLMANWPQISFTMSGTPAQGSALVIDLRWLLLFPLVAALWSAYSFNRQWIRLTPVSPGVGAALDSLSTPDLQWVSPPFGEHYWIEGAVARGLKIAVGTQGWTWRDRDAPLPVRELSREGTPEGMSFVREFEGVNLYAAPPGREYAVVNGVDGSRTVCSAQGTGGDLAVTCDAPAGGNLTVLENSYPGWSAAIDGAAARLVPGRWLSVLAPPGKHTITFAYRPVDAMAGILLFIAGVAWAAYLWFKREPPPSLVEST